MRELRLTDDRKVPMERPVIVGIINATPDSFSDGGLYPDAAAAVTAGLRMVALGAGVIDVGGESTRPGAQPVDARSQMARVLPVIEGLRCSLSDRGLAVAISIDTTSAEVARAAIEHGADIINDVSAGRHDARMFPLAAETGSPIVLMHMQGTPKTMQGAPSYHDVVTEVIDFLSARAEAAISDGVCPNAIILDPGIGFGKTTAHNIELLAGLDRLVRVGYPVMLGASRKRFIGEVAGGAAGGRPDGRVGGTCTTTALGVAAGVVFFRVHDVEENRQAADIAWAVRAGQAASL